MKLIAKTSIAIGIIAILTIVALGYTIYYYYQSTLTEIIAEKQLEIAKATLATIDRTLYERYLDVQNIASSELVSLYLTSVEDRAEIEDSVVREFTKRLPLTGPWDELEVVDKNGIHLISSEINYKNDDEHFVIELEAIKAALSGKLYYSDVHIGERGEPTIVYAAPIQDFSLPDNPIVGAVLGNYAWPVIEEIIQNAVSDNSHIHLFNKDGIMIATNEDPANLFNDSAKRVHDYTYRASEINTIILENNERTDEVLTSHAQQSGYFGYKGSGWELLIETPTSVAFEAARSNSVRIIIIVAVLYIVALLFLLSLLLIFVLNPINKLDKVAKEIMVGNYNVQAEVKSEDEIGMLARSFNEMAKKLSLEMSEAKRLPENVLRSMKDSLFVVNREGNITEANQAALEMLGYKREELIGKPLSKVFSQTDINAKTHSDQEESEKKDAVKDIPDPNQNDVETKFTNIEGRDFG
jgi:PAS domain-containing protein